MTFAEEDPSVQRMHELLTKNEDAQKMFRMLVAGGQLATWIMSEFGTMDDMTERIVELLYGQYQHAVSQPFNALELLETFEKAAPWLASKRNELLVRRTKRERRLRDLAQRLKRKDIPLPFGAMTRLFGEHGFTYRDLLVVLGPKDLIVPVLRRCAREYTTANGKTTLLVSGPVPPLPKRVATTVLPITSWRNCAEGQPEITQFVKTYLPDGGLLVVEDVDQMVSASSDPRGRMIRLAKAVVLLMQTQMDSGVAAIVGVDDDRKEGDDDYVELERAARVIRVARSQVDPTAAWIVIGNDVVKLTDIEEAVNKA